MLSTLAGWASDLFSEASAAAEICATMNPELRPLDSTRNGGKPLKLVSTRKAIRRSAMAPISASAIARTSAAIATGSAWKFPPEMHVAVSGEHDRVVRDGIGFDRERARDEAHRVEARAHHLRLTAQRIRILDARAIPMRRHDAAAFEQFAIRGGDVDLALMAADGVDARIERNVASLGRLQRKRAGDDRRREDVLGAQQSADGERGRHLGAVDQREAFLGSELDGT